MRLVLEDRVELPRLYLNWVSPAIFADGDADLDLVADVLADGKSSRLYKAMVYERRIATDVTALQQSRELSGFFQVIGTAAPGHALARARGGDVAPRSRSVAESGPTAAELQKSLAQAEAQFVYRVQTVGGFGGKSDQLNQYNVFVGDPGYFDRDLQRYREATPDVGGRRCPALPRPRPARGAERRPARPARPRPARFHEGGVLLMVIDRSRLPAPGPDPVLRFPEVRRRVLGNGLRVTTVEHRGVPVVSFLLLLSRGSAAIPAERTGLAALTADMLDEGSGDRSALDIEDALAGIGAQFETEVGIGRDGAVAADAAALLGRRAVAAVGHRHPPAPRRAPTSTASASSA